MLIHDLNILEVSSYCLTAPFVTAFAFAKLAPIASRTGLQVKTAFDGRYARLIQ